MSSERTSLEGRLEELEYGLESAYYQYRLKHPGSAPLPFFNITPFDVANPTATDEVDGLGCGSSPLLPNGFSGDGPASLPSNLHVSTSRPRGDRFLTVTPEEHFWQVPASNMVGAKLESNNAIPKMADPASPISPYKSSFATPSSPPQTLRTTHHFLNTTPPSSPRSDQTTTSHTKGVLPQSPHIPSSSPSAAAKRPPPHGRLQRTRAYATSHTLLQTPTSSSTAYTNSQDLSWSYPTKHSLSQPSLRGPSFSNKQGHINFRNSMPEKLILTTIAENTVSNDNSRVGTTPQRSPAFRRRSDSGGNFERSGKSQLLTRRISQDSLETRV